MFERILLPTDGSPGSHRASEVAIDLSREYDAALEVLHVVDETVLPLDAHSSQYVESLEEEARRSVEEIVERATEAGVDADGTHEHGVPHETILAAIEDRDCDAVVMGTHGRRGLVRYVLGSTTERVLRLADVPVVAVPMREE